MNKIIRLPKVKELVGLGKTAIYGRIKIGEFPEQVKLGSASGWIEGEVIAWINKQAASRQAHGN